MARVSTICPLGSRRMFPETLTTFSGPRCPFTSVESQATAQFISLSVDDLAERLSVTNSRTACSSYFVEVVYKDFKLWYSYG